MKRVTGMAAVCMAAVLATGIGCAGKGGLSKGAAALDTDKDGKISKAEFIARYENKQKAMTLFQKLDSSGDGFLDHNETGTYPDDFWAKTETNAEP